MPSAIEAAKEERVGAAAALAEGLADPAERELLRRFVVELYAHAPPGDIAMREAKELFGAALGLWRFAGVRGRANAKMRGFNPDPPGDGWASPDQGVEILNYDNPVLGGSGPAGVKNN